MFRMSFFRAGVTIVALVGCVSITQAGPIYEGNYTGVLNNVPDELSAFFDPGAAVVGTFTFDAGGGASAIGLDGLSAVYENLLSFKISIARKDTASSYTAEFTSSSDGREIQVEDGPGNEHIDRLLVLGLQSSGLVGPELNGFVIDSAGPHLEDTVNNTAISGIAVPTSIDLGQFDVRTVGITFVDAVTPTGDVGIAAFLPFDATITSFDIHLLQEVPEPSTLVMLSGAACTLVGVVFARRRRSRPTAA